jgi:hypothetical protein
MVKSAKKVRKESVSAKRATPEGEGGKKMLRVPMHSVVHFVKMLHDEKQAAKFTRAARDSKAVLTMHPSTVDFVRKFVADNKLHHAMATKVVDPCPGDPFECHFRD